MSATGSPPGHGTPLPTPVANRRPPDPARPTAEARVCARCRRELAARYFWRNRQRPDGLASTCIACHRIHWDRRRRRLDWRGPNARGEWRCRDCDAWKPAAAFRPPPPGRGCPKSICRACEAARARLAQRQRRADPQAAGALRASRRERDRRLGAPKRHWRAAMRTADAQRVVAKLLAAGWSVQGIARAVGSNWCTVRDWRDGSRAVSNPTVRRLQQLELDVLLLRHHGGEVLP